jgi:hypothetical protein
VSGPALPNSAANSLPTAVYGRKIPLPGGQPDIVQQVDKQHVLGVEKTFLGRKTRFFPAVREMPAGLGPMALRFAPR